MNKADKEKLIKMLRDLCNRQDSVTHYNEQGEDCINETLQAIACRNEVRDEIISFVDGLSDPARKTNNDVHKNYCLDNGGVPTPAWVGFDPEV